MSERRVRDAAAQIVVDHWKPTNEPADRLKAIHAIRALVRSKDEEISRLKQALDRVRRYTDQITEVILTSMVGGQKP